MNNQAWIDILPPPPPVDTVSWWAWLIIIMIFFMLTLTIFLWRKTPKQTALRKLKSIRRSLNENKDLRQIPFQISSALKTGFKVNHINNIKMDNLSQWLEYRQLLTRVCFSKQSPSIGSLEALLSDTEVWLKTGASRHE